MWGMTASQNIRALAREGMSTAEIARRLGIRYQTAYAVLKPRVVPAKVSKFSHKNAQLDLTDALILVSCVSQKMDEPAPARLLYQSVWFKTVRAFIEARNADWLILSAQHGLISPETRIAPYEKTLNSAGVAERRAWADKVYGQIQLNLQGKRRIVIFAGERYREFLTPALERNGYTVEIPMVGLRIGEQLAWLAA